MNQKITKVEVDPKDINPIGLKELLEYGDAKKISEQTGYSHGYVNIVLNPNNDRFNAEIIKAAVNLVKERNENKIKLDPSIASKLTKNGESRENGVRKSSSD